MFLKICNIIHLTLVQLCNCFQHLNRYSKLSKKYSSLKAYIYKYLLALSSLFYLNFYTNSNYIIFQKFVDINYVYSVIKRSKVQSYFINYNFCTSNRSDIDSSNFVNFSNLSEFFYVSSDVVFGKPYQSQKYFCNFCDKRLSTYRCARLVHWNLFTHKTINERRYRLFLKKRLKMQSREINNSPYYFFLLNFRFRLPWQFWKHIINSFYLLFNVEKIIKNTIYQLPLHFTIFQHASLFKKKQQRWRRYVTRWSRGNYTRSTRFWLPPRLKLPKVFKQLTAKTRSPNYFLQFDYLTFSFVLIHQSSSLPKYQGVWGITQNNMLKLLSYRYRP